MRRRPTAPLPAGRPTALAVVAVLIAAGAGRAAHAQRSPPPLPPPAAPAFAEDSTPPEEDPLAAQIRQNEELAARRRPTVTLNGYVDFGFYAVEGDGSGVRQDVLHTYPGYPGYAWVFPGDLLAPAINTRGEVANLGDLPGVDRYDPIHSGAPGFIVNELNLRLRASPVPTAIITGSLNFTPRTGGNFALGDMFDVDLAQLEWLPTESQRTSIFVGKIESVLGIEYRQRKSDQRFGVTPSLIARYTTGTALGVKVRSKFGDDDWLVIAAALTNGSNTTEQFFFYDETARHAWKTGSARLSVRLPLPFTLELGASGSYGAQDRTSSDQHRMWFAGIDLQAHVGPVDVLAQWLTGRAPGDVTENAYSLDLHGGGYVEVHAMLTSSWGVLGSVGYRSADITLPTTRAYPSRNWRGTVGVRWMIDTWAILKAEYLHNGEYGDVPTIPDDVFTSSLVLTY